MFYAGSFVHSVSDKLDNSLISVYNNYIFAARNSSGVSIGSGLGNPRQLDGALVWTAGGGSTIPQSIICLPAAPHGKERDVVRGGSLGSAAV